MAIEDRIQIASAASVLLGADQIQSFDEDTTEALAARSFYDDVYETALRSNNWTFAKSTEKLQRLDKKASYGYKYVYRVPVDVLKVMSLQNERSNYKLASSREIHTDLENAFVTVLIRPDEKMLPGDFKLAFKYLLAAAMAPTVTDDSSQQQRFELKGAQLLKAAGGVDIVQTGNLSYKTSSTLLNVHSGG